MSELVSPKTMISLQTVVSGMNYGTQRHRPVNGFQKSISKAFNRTVVHIDL